MSHPYNHLISEYARLQKEGRACPLGGFKPAPRPKLAANAPKALFFAPHPDDECIDGGLAVRLIRQAHMNVIDVAVTLGSNKARQAGRLQELENACGFIGYGLIPTSSTGLEHINLKTREQNSAHWTACVKVIRALIEKNQPKVILCPHDKDWNSTHIGTHFLVMDALKQMPASYECYLVETEFWGAMSDPNLMVEVSPEDAADLIAALSFHVGEVGRNPYHLSLPGWMMDNVRRGGEVVGGQGGAVPDFLFSQLYRLRKWTGGQAVKFYEGGKLVPSSMNVAELFA